MDFEYLSLRNGLFLLALIVAVKKIPFINYYFKFTIYVLYVSLWAIIYMPVFLLRPRDVMNLHTGAMFMKYAAQLTGLSYKFENLERLKQDKTMVVVANHQSCLDIIDMWSSFGKLTVIAKREIIFVGGPWGISAWLAGLKFISRKKGKQTGQLINEALVEMKTKNIKLWVFPEGTRRNTGQIHEFKKGAFLAAIYAQVPIIPVVYSSYMPFLDHKNKIFNSSEITIHVMDEIPTDGLTAADVDGLMAKTHQLMSLKFKETSDGLKQL